MNRTYIRDIQADGPVKVQGFVENLRDGKAMAFLVIKDITGKIQVTVEKEKFPEVAEQVARLTPDSVVTVEGDVVFTEFVKMGGKEIRTEYIIHSPEGKPYNPNNWANRVFRPFMQRLHREHPRHTRAFTPRAASYQSHSLDRAGHRPLHGSASAGTQRPEDAHKDI